MVTGFFLKPSTWICKGTVPVDYRVERRDIDKRTRFYRNNIKWEISAYIAVCEAERHGLRVFREDGAVTRILAPNAKSARAYYECLQRVCDFGKEVIR